MFGPNIGSAAYAADSVVGKSGKPIRVFNWVQVAGAGGAGQVVLRNGTSASGTAYVVVDGSAASKGKTESYEGGLLFPGGCFYDHDSNNANVTINFRVEQ